MICAVLGKVANPNSDTISMLTLFIMSYRTIRQRSGWQNFENMMHEFINWSPQGFQRCYHIQLKWKTHLKLTRVPPFWPSGFWTSLWLKTEMIIITITIFMVIITIIIAIITAIVIIITTITKIIVRIIIIIPKTVTIPWYHDHLIFRYDHHNNHRDHHDHHRDHHNNYHDFYIIIIIIRILLLKDHHHNYYDHLYFVVWGAKVVLLKTFQSLEKRKKKNAKCFEDNKARYVKDWTNLSLISMAISLDLGNMGHI